MRRLAPRISTSMSSSRATICDTARQQRHGVTSEAQCHRHTATLPRSHSATGPTTGAHLARHVQVDAELQPRHRGLDGCCSVVLRGVVVGGVPDLGHTGECGHRGAQEVLQTRHRGASMPQQRRRLRTVHLRHTEGHTRGRCMLKRDTQARFTSHNAPYETSAPAQ
jgi:hypothetical protein